MYCGIKNLEYWRIKTFFKWYIFWIENQNKTTFQFYQSARVKQTAINCFISGWFYTVTHAQLASDLMPTVNIFMTTGLLENMNIYTIACVTDCMYKIISLNSKKIVSYLLFFLNIFYNFYIVQHSAHTESFQTIANQIKMFNYKIIILRLKII